MHFAVSMFRRKLQTAVGMMFGWRVIDELGGILEAFVMDVFDDTDRWYYAEPIVAIVRYVA